jgi:glyoxylase-like metal-dependent hydrolase (beta-lactamase superfamily II)
MRVHHLNCGSLRPFNARLVNGEGGLFSPGLLVCHCLLIESESGLVLVDTGVGLIDMPPRHTLGRYFETLVRPALDPDQTALRQVERLGFSSDDVRHIVMTHLDLDHAGGLPDFPHAKVHVLDVEHEVAMKRRAFDERVRYVKAHWAHNPEWVVHSAGGDRWMGFDSVRAIEGDAGPEVLLVPLAGHTRGHSGVAVHTDTGWLLHCGDAYFYGGEMDVNRPHCSAGLRIFQQLSVVERGPRNANQERLRQLKRDKGEEITLFCSHDHVELENLHVASQTDRIVVS